MALNSSWVADSDRTFTTALAEKCYIGGFRSLSLYKQHVGLVHFESTANPDAALESQPKAR